MKYFKVALTKYIGTDVDILTYSYADEVPRGTGVIVPVRNREIVGIVIGNCPKPNFEVKEIIKIFFEYPILSDSMIKTCSWISDYYGASISSVFQAVIPPGINKKRRTIEKNTVNNNKAFKNPKNLVLTEDQEAIIKSIKADKTNTPHLIFGITGSGKTEIYFQLIEETLKKDKQAIVLVPEISLTPQAIERYTAKFGDNIAILHSYQKETERFNNWKKVLEGKKQIIIGPRSALFAPCNNLGIIIIDEAHENTYKQEQTPKYNAVEVAEKLASLCGAELILGTATPTVEQFYKAKTGKYKLHEMNKRIAQEVMPNVEIINMADEFKKRNFSVFSDCLKEEIISTLERNQQVILFMNRRGMATFVSCRECDYVEKCINCEIPMTYHINENQLICHHCGYKTKTPERCPSCGSYAIKFFGGGTQKIENELRKIVDDSYSIARMDKDSVNTDGKYTQMYNSFVQGKIDILIGTQMISKGWDVPNVGLVGIVSADTLLNFPDIFSPERTFSLLTQVAGRTGRGAFRGKVIIQTYSPDNPAIIAAANHNFVKFYKEEILERKELNYPPFAKLIKLLYNNEVKDEAVKKSIETANLIKNAFAETKIDFKLMGPSPAFVTKVAGKYRWQIILKIMSSDEKDIIKSVGLLKKITKNEWSIDVDPASLI